MKGKKTNLFLIVIMLLALFISCQEEVSEDLESSSSSSSGGSSGSSSDDDSEDNLLRFQLKNNFPKEMSYHLHKTGQGNKSKKCEITATNAVEFNTTSQKSIDCFLEVEELDLFRNGLDLQIKADEGLCEYISYRPFGFYQYRPGATAIATNKDTYVCNDAATAGGCALCDTTTDPGEPDFVFDYSESGGPNCDSGSAIITNRSVPVTYPGSVCTTGTPVIVDVDDPIKAGGSMRNCMAGAVTDLEGFPEFTGHLLYNTDLSKISKNYKHKSPEEEQYGSNRKLANFMRMCSVALNTASYSTPATQYLFDGDIISDYAYQNGAAFDSTAYGTTSTPVVVGATTTTEYEYAHDGIFSAGPVSPFYGVYCLDKARDIKARIRLYVREWDREFSKSSPYLEFVSDVDSGGTTPRMDTTLGATIEFPDEGVNGWNDFEDWDDFLTEGANKVNPACTQPVYAGGEAANFIGGAL